MEYGIWSVTLEVRAKGGRRTLLGRFPYNVQATVANRGRVRKERFRSGSMAWQVREFERLQGELAEAIDRGVQQGMIDALHDGLEKRNTHLLVGHDYNRAIADMRSGTLQVRHTDDAVELEAALPAEDRQPSWVRDAVLAVEGGQLRGLSPGFQVTTKGAERMVPEDNGPSMVREILDATVFEYSLVARPAYPTTSVDARADEAVAQQRRHRVWL